MQVERIWEFLRRLTPSTKNCLLTELERLEMCGIDMPCSADIQARLRAELRKDGSTQSTATPFRYFFAPLQPLLVDAAPECIKIVAGDGRLLQMNSAGLEMIEAKSWESVERASVFDLRAGVAWVPRGAAKSARFNCFDTSVAVSFGRSCPVSMEIFPAMSLSPSLPRKSSMPIC